jgi:RNA polymerase sigma-70 factor (ECF subfamily)
MSPASEALAGPVESVVAPGRPPRAGAARARSERALIRGAAAGSEDDLAQLFRRFWPRAYRIAFLIAHDHAAAEDIAQEAFVQAIRRLDRFDRRRHFAPWLGAIVANRAIDWTRARTARRESGGEPPEPVAPPDAPSGRYSEEVMGALAALTPEHRAVVVLRYVLEYTPGEIARALDLPRGTVNSRLRRRLDALKAHLVETEADLR